MERSELEASLRRILEGFEGVPVGEVSDLPILFALQDIAEFVGGEVQQLAARIDLEYWALAHPGVAHRIEED